MFQCTFTVQNQDSSNFIESLVVTNTVPFPGGETTAVDCNQGGDPVTTLAPLGTAADTCTGAVDETAPFCTGTDSLFGDQIVMHQKYSRPPLPIPLSARRERGWSLLPPARKRSLPIIVLRNSF